MVALQSHLHTYGIKNFKVTHVHSDGESGIQAKRYEIEAIGVQVNTTGPDQHVPIAGNAIKTIKMEEISVVNALSY